MKLNVTLLLLAFCKTLFVKGQIQVSGTIATGKIPIENVNVTLEKKSNKNIIAFGFSDENGKFSLINNSNEDSLNIVFSIIGFKTVTRIIKNTSQIINCELEETIAELPNVVIKQDPITEKNDTTRYNVNQLKGKQDRVIADVIAKLPGVDIDATTGQISFNGKAISHFYIDGLDLLGSKYNIANQNIPAELVDQLQMLTNDKDIKLLDSLKRSNNAAINIKLKKNGRNKLIGRGKLGTGLAPLLYENDITALLFKKSLQLINGYKNNNTGNAISSELSDNYSIQRVGERAARNDKEPVLNVITANNPPLTPIRFLLNNTHMGYINVLKVLANKAQIKTNISYVNNNTINSNNINTTLYLPTGNVVFNEKINNFINTNQLASNIEYSLNTNKKFIKNKTEFTLDVINENTKVENIQLIEQKINTPFYNFKNNFNLLLPFKKKLISFNSKVNYSHLPQRLTVIPGQFSPILNQGFPYELTAQRAALSNFNTDNSLAFTTTIGKLLNQVKFGTEVIQKKLTSQTAIEVNKQEKNLNDSFSNNTKWRNYRIYVENAITFSKNERILEITLPIEANTVQILNYSSAKGAEASKVFFNPIIDFNAPLSKKSEISISYNYQANFGNLIQTTDKYILKNYRTLSNNDVIIPIEKQHTAFASFGYKNPLKAVFANIAISVSQTNRNSINSQNFNNFLSTNTNILLKNKTQNSIITANFSKYIISQKIKLSLTTSTNFYKTDVLQQQKLVTSLSNMYNFNFSIDYNKLTWMALNVNSKLTIFSNRLKGLNNTNNGNLNLTQTAKLYFFTSATTTIQLSGEYYKIGESNSKKSNFAFIDLTLSKQFKKCSFDIAWTNIFDNRNFEVINNNENFKQTTSFYIRPTNILAKFNFRF
jgi:hypothetical protein